MPAQISAYAAPEQHASAVNSDARKDICVFSEKNKYGHKAIKGSVRINASVKEVWDAIRDHRESDPDVASSKLTYLPGNERVLEQKYVAIPVIGSTSCTLKLDEDLYKRIDYTLMKSDRIKEFEGSWVLTSEDEHSTTLELSNHLKLHLPIPQRLIDAFAQPKLKARLAMVKKIAETKRQSQIASRE